jgi:hypothetical protein
MAEIIISKSKTTLEKIIFSIGFPCSHDWNLMVPKILEKCIKITLFVCKIYTEFVEIVQFFPEKIELYL